MAGRPREFDRDQALERARDTFWARGYEATSMAGLIAATGIASASLYAAFGSKEALFREAVALYDANEGGFADRALAGESTARAAIARMLGDAVRLFTRIDKPRGCMVVLSAINCSGDNDAVGAWLATYRRARHASILSRLRHAVDGGELKPDTDIQALADFYATFLQGLSIQARDGVSKKRMQDSILQAMQVLDAAST